MDSFRQQSQTPSCNKHATQILLAMRAHVENPCGSEGLGRTERAQPACRVLTTVTTSFSPNDSTGTRLAPVASATFTKPFLHAHNPFAMDRCPAGCGVKQTCEILWQCTGIAWEPSNC